MPEVVLDDDLADCMAARRLAQRIARTSYLRRRVSVQ